jgi:hypothetical protein
MPVGSKPGPRPGGRKTDIKRKQSICSVHGTTEFAQYATGIGNAYSHWQCMLCNCENNKRWREVNKNRPKPEARKAVKVVEVKTCPTHFLVLPATGICEECA